MNEQTVLVVDDEAALLSLVGRMLKDEGYCVLLAGGPSEAIRLAEEHSVSLLLTDVAMPEMSGQELAAMLVSLDPQLKCVFMSGHTFGILEDGMFLQKPFKSKDLVDKVKQVLNHES